jgi:hypothetical protein
MKVPSEFTRFVMGFYLGSQEEGQTDDEWIASVLRHFTNAERREVVRVFLDKVLDGNYSDDELARLWTEPRPCINFSMGGHRWFLGEIRRVLNQKWPKGKHPR